MTKHIEMETEFRDIFSKLMFGTREEFKDAKKQIEKKWKTDHHIFAKAAPVALEYIARFDEIQKTENQAAFASGLHLFYLALGDDYFDQLKNFTLKLLQYTHGHVRESIRKTAEWLYMSLSDRVDPFIYPAGKDLSDEQKKIQIEAQKQYINLVREIESLIDLHPDQDGIEFVDEMKPSINKTLQQFWNRLTEGRVYRRIIEKTRPVSMEMFVKRREIEYDITKLLKDSGDEVDFEDVLDIIYNEDDSGDFQQLIALFDRGGDASELDNILATVTDAWNYFPHKSLNGASPAEITFGSPSI